jgi:3'-phosphoadenosine 5'-phosphosulfate sulfotransferase (PAPS reductase)/FAD synthetase
MNPDLQTEMQSRGCVQRMVRRHTHEWGDSGFCVHCGKQNPADAADERAGYWLSRGNELKEKGKLDAAEKCYEKSANWLIRANDLRGL